MLLTGARVDKKIQELQNSKASINHTIQFEVLSVRVIIFIIVI